MELREPSREMAAVDLLEELERAAQRLDRGREGKERRRGTATSGCRSVRTVSEPPADINVAISTQGMASR